MQDFSSERPASILFPPAAIPAEPVGIGLRAPYYQEALKTDLNLGWLEVHPENYFGGGIHRHFLSKIRERFQISFHGVGLSLGSAQPVDENHLRQLKDLISIYDPFHVSDHASWSTSGNAHLGDLLPLPYTHETLSALCCNIDRTQNYLGRRMLLENPSSYIAFDQNDVSEAEFMNAAAQKTGCLLLLDINNIFVQAFNHDFDGFEYIDTINPLYVGEMHLAGHTERAAGSEIILVDTHNKPVCGEVWDLYQHAVRRFGAVPTLIEWDQDFPPLHILVAEADKARTVIVRAEQERLFHAAE
ncbi:MAG: DUF692 domain-containing protein [Alphaproteobacteria bacterium]|nr:DUF692 domain-containing protein [Alphaproteobacteria bacterium]